MRSYSDRVSGFARHLFLAGLWFGVCSRGGREQSSGWTLVCKRDGHVVKTPYRSDASVLPA